MAQLRGCARGRSGRGCGCGRRLLTDAPSPPDERIGPGAAFPLGVSLTPEGVNVAVASVHATAIEFCLFDADGARETERFTLPSRTGDVWHGHVAGVVAGRLYGLRAHGPYAPEYGHRFNSNKLLLDPYARALSGALVPHDALCGYRVGDPDADLSFDRRDSAPYLPKGVVAAAEAPCPDTRPRTPWRDTLVYEAHVRGLTMLHPDIPPELRGTYGALGHPAVTGHLRSLGVTALELLPIHHFADDRFLLERGLTNYWGYSTLNYFCPDPRYGSAESLREAVAALHAAGIEVILDVVYNHTAELDELGPTLCFRGLDNAGSYRLRPEAPRYDVNWTGTGNTLDLSRPAICDLVLSSLRHWAEAYGIDGFRFDLAPILGRTPDAFDPRAPFFERLAADPVLGSLKMIAEPWDIGPDGYRLGQFPAGWSEWSDRFRDTARAFWRGDPGQAPRLAEILSGSREAFGQPGRGPRASINIVTTHDGFTLEDVASYTERHNEANREGNRDGHAHNLSLNHGEEGPSRDPAILAARARHKRNLLATLFLAQGVPMLLGGDELGRSQGGNNNAYCQDNPTSWLDWRAGPARDPDLQAFVANLAGLRRALPALRRDTFLTGEPVGPEGLPDVVWLLTDGREMDVADWQDPERRILGFQTGHDIEGGAVLLWLNAGEEPCEVARPERPGGARWRFVFDSTLPRGLVELPEDASPEAGTFTVPPRSAVLLRMTT